MFRRSCLLALLIPASALAVPAELNHQGRLLDASGVPLEGLHQLEFILYDSAVAGSPVWSEVLNINFVGGYYSVVLGADAFGNPLTDTHLGEPQLHLALRVDGGGEMPTRAQVASIPYARIAGTSVNVSGGVVDATEIYIDGTLVIDGTGTFTGTANDTLESLNCFPGELAVYNGADWVCQAQAPGDWLTLLNIPADLTDGDADTLAATMCPSDQILVSSGAAWGCGDDQDTQLSPVDVTNIMSTNGVALPTSTTLDWSSLLSVPPDLADGDADSFATFVCPDGFIVSFGAGLPTCLAPPVDSDTLGALSAICSDAEIARYDGGSGTWVCSADLDTTRSDGEILTVIADNPVVLDPGTTIDWANVSNKPAGFADDDDADAFSSFSCPDGMYVTFAAGVATCALDTFGTFVCPDGEHIVYSGGAAACALATDSDSFATFSCPDDEVISYAGGAAVCAVDATRTDGDIVNVVQTTPLAFHIATTIPWDQVSGKPAGFADNVDNDADSFAQFSCPIDGDIIVYTAGSAFCTTPFDSDALATLELLCTDGEIPKLNGGTGNFDCASDAVLTSVDVLGIVDQSVIDLGIGSSVDGTVISTGSHIPQLTQAEVVTHIESFATDISLTAGILASSFETTSDARFKTNVEGLGPVLSDLHQVRGVRYDWNDAYPGGGPHVDDVQIGVIAQEVEQVFPEVVYSRGEDELRSVDYAKLTAVLIEAVKELDDKVEMMQARIDELEAQQRTLGD